MKRLPKTAKCPRCGQTIIEAAGLFRCPKDGGFETALHESRYDKPMTRREREYQYDPGQLPPIDGRPIPLDRRIK